MHDYRQMFMGFRISKSCQSSYWGFLVAYGTNSSCSPNEMIQDTANLIPGAIA